MTRVINLFAGPGAGKSTLAALVFSELKLYGVNAELVTEFAKDLTWEGRQLALRHQPYVFGEQYHRLRRLVDAGVAWIVTDSPLLLSCVYQREETSQAFRDSCYGFYREFNNENFLVSRKTIYNPAGRLQSRAEAEALDDIIAGVAMREYGLPFYPGRISCSSDGAGHLISYVLNKDTMHPCLSSQAN